MVQPEKETPLTATKPKPIWTSVTFWGVMISAALKLASLAGVDVVVEDGFEDEAAVWVSSQTTLLLSFIGDAIAVIGRVRAKQQVVLAPRS